MSVIAEDQLLNLSNPDSLRALFASLGFTPDYTIFYSADTLEWPANVAADLGGREFERIASVDDDVFQVLVLPPAEHGPGFGLGLQRRLLKTLTERLSEGLLILPNNDWDVFELVLLASQADAADDAQPAPMLRWSFTPRTLRPHQLRALELMDVTGLSGLDVADQLRRAFARAAQESLFRAPGFFSTYYLEERIASDPAVSADWASIQTSMPVLHAVVSTPVPALDAILPALGWTVSATTDAVQRLEAHGQPVALLATVERDAPLEGEGEGSSTQAQFDLVAALRQEKERNGLQWGILTNGRRWRLYSTLTSSISGAYYEVDLRDLLAFGDLAELAFFGAFFSAAGLAPSSAAPAFVQRVFYSSQTLSRQVGEDLKAIVFNDVFPHIASGIAEALQQAGRYDGSPEQLRLIFRATLIVLYRLLFLLYAESRRLLPTLHPAYYPHSLTRLLTEIALRPFVPEQNRKPLGPTSYWIWAWLTDLWQAVDQGNPAWGVPRYNGGLFSNAAASSSIHKEPYKLLNSLQIGAMDLHVALDFLGRDREARAMTSGDTLDQARRLIDYAALDVRRLGSIYEGLLEYQLVENHTAQGIRLELLNTRQERKASGSYYTPDYIVQYIVAQTAGPVLAERARRFRELLPQWHASKRAAERAERERCAGWDVMQRDARTQEQTLVETLLDLKVLDPAMGSGHFLVEAVDFLTDGLIDVLKDYPENPLTTRLATIRQEIKTSMADQKIEAEFLRDEQLSDARLLRRLVMKRCVYGVDLNDMAVELSKLSLWLHSFTVGAPLSFLDHHLKWGNSLIGARVQDVQEQMEGKKTAYGQQIDMFGANSSFRGMLNVAAQIEELVQIADANATQVEQSTELYAIYEQEVIPVKRLLDLWVAQYFDAPAARDLIRLHTGKPEHVTTIVEALMDRRALPANQQPAINAARDLFAQYRFFHWDLEFPEVFIDLVKKDWKPEDVAGFDVVVGNPPYDILIRSEYNECYIDYVNEQYYTSEYNPNLFALFSEKSIDVTKYSGLVSIIVPNMWIMNNKYSKMRENLIDKTFIIEILDMGFTAFDENIPTSIFVLKKYKNKNNDLIMKFNAKYREIPGEILHINQNILMNYINKGFNRLFNNNDIKSIYINVIDLGEIYTIYRGIETIDNKKYISNYKRDENDLEIIDASDVLRNYVGWSGDFIRFIPKELKSNADIKMYNVPEKVLLRRTGDQLISAVDYNGFLASKNLYLIIPKSIYSAPYICLLLNSTLINWERTQRTRDKGQAFAQIKVVDIIDLPIRRINFTTPEPERAALVGSAEALYRSGLAQAGVPEDWRGWRARWHAVWDWADGQLPLLDDGMPAIDQERSDAVHDLLAFLAQQMIDLNKQKQVAAREFTAWLDVETGSTSADWTLKTIIQSYWEQPWEEIERALHKNRKHFVQTATLRGRHADLALEPVLRSVRGRWEVSVAALAPTLAAIAATDRLIDLLVYRLYGLTDAEIDTVEAGL